MLAESSVFTAVVLPPSPSPLAVDVPAHLNVMPEHLFPCLRSEFGVFLSLGALRARKSDMTGRGVETIRMGRR